MVDYLSKQKSAADELLKIMSLPLPKDCEDCGMDGIFDPWNIFPMFYGSYCSSFDDMAIKVLENIRDGEFEDETLAHEMFREVLCTMNLCDYGTSPRVCFASQEFHKMIPELVQKWKDYSAIWWQVRRA